MRPSDGEAGPRDAGSWGKPLAVMSRMRARSLQRSGSSPTSTEIGTLTGGYGHLFRRAHILFCNHYNAHFAKEGIQITPVLGGMLILIDEHPGLSQIELARLLRIEAPSMWENVARLVDLGYIERRRAENDRRAFALYLSAHGREVLARVLEGMRQHQRVLLSVLSEQERERLSSMLLRLIDHGEQLMGGDVTKSNRIVSTAPRDDRSDASRCKEQSPKKRGAKHA